MNVGMMIREARVSADLSQVELARRAGTSQPALARYEASTTLPTLPTLERLLHGCGQQLQLHTIRSDGRPAKATSVRGQIGSHARRLRHSRRRLLDSAGVHGVRAVRVFGSVARGTDDPTSDIDLLVELEPGRTLLDLIGFRNQATDILGIPIDVATSDMLKERIRSEVLAEALPI